MSYAATFNCTVALKIMSKKPHDITSEVAIAVIKGYSYY